MNSGHEPTCVLAMTHFGVSLTGLQRSFQTPSHPQLFIQALNKKLDTLPCNLHHNTGIRHVYGISLVIPKSYLIQASLFTIGVQKAAEEYTTRPGRHFLQSSIYPHSSGCSG
jgi:hypothetical protein